MFRSKMKLDVPSCLSDQGSGNLFRGWTCSNNIITTWLSPTWQHGNVNSMVRKGPLLHDLIDDVGCDVFVISETKLNVADTAFYIDMRALPTGYSGIFSG